MKKRKLLMTAITIAILLIGMGKLMVNQDQTQKATWLWDSTQIQHQKESIIEFLNEEHVQSLYLQINQNIPVQDYQTFIKQASQTGVDVYALGGAPEWARSTSCQECVDFVQWVEVYQEKSDSSQQFVGIHLDIEPYLLDTWENDRTTIIKNFQYRVLWFEEQSTRLQLELEADAPFWFDQVNFNNVYGQNHLSKWLLDHVDRLSIMAYREAAEGPNGIIALVDQEIQWANDTNKQIIVSIETTKTKEDHTTFYDRGLKAFMAEQDKVQRTVGGNSSFWGFGIHDMNGWMRLTD